MVADRLVADRLAEFTTRTSFASFPEEVIDYAKRLVLSFLASVFAGVPDPASGILTQYIRDEGGTPESGVMGCGFRTSSSQATLANATFGHASELEDNSFPDAISTFRMIPTSLALGEKLRASGAEVLESFVIGQEVGSRVLRACSGLRERGFSGSVIGTLGVAAGAAKILKLDAKKTAMALSIAAQHAQGLSRQSGSMAHFYDMGICARNGTVSALLARGGFTGVPNIIEDSPGGLCYAFAGEGKYNLEKMTDSLGKPFCVMDVGIKKYACCWVEHGPIDALIELKDKYHISYENVDSIEVHVGPYFSGFVRYSEPKTVDESRFSVHHSFAAVFLEKRVSYNPSIYTEEKISSPKYREAWQKTKVIAHPERKFTPLGEGELLIVKLKDGKKYETESKLPKGVPPSRLEMKDVSEKFRNCVQFGKFLSEDQATQVAEAVGSLERLKDITVLTDLLTYGKKRPVRKK